MVKIVAAMLLMGDCSVSFAVRLRLLFALRDKSKPAVAQSQIPPSRYGGQARANPSNWRKHKPVMTVTFSLPPMKRRART